MNAILHRFLSDHMTVEKFTKLYQEGRTIKQISKTLGIPERRAYWFKKKLKLQTIPRWVQRGVPKEIHKTTKMILRGSLLGDASISQKYKSSTYEYSITHGPKQIEYLRWKHQQLWELKPQKIAPSGDKWGCQRFGISHHPYIEQLYKEYYFPKKQITIDLLYQLDNLALALWFMDDGNAYSHGYSLATCSFTLEENYLIKDYFKQNYNIKVKVSNYDYPRIHFQKEASNLFKVLVERHVIASMKYKLYRSGID